MAAPSTSTAAHVIAPAASTNGAGTVVGGAGAEAPAPAPATAVTPDGFVQIGAEDCPPGTPVVKGPEFNDGVEFDKLMASFATMGFQGTHMAQAVDEVMRMLSWRLSDEPYRETEGDEWKDAAVRANTRCTIFLAFTSNMVSAGTREIIRYLVEHRLVSAIVTTAGAVEEDVMKTLRPHYIGDFALKGSDLRMKGINRTGNLLVPNLNYSAFEEWFVPLLHKMHDEQDGKGAGATSTKAGSGGGGRGMKKVWSPSRIIERMGQEVNDASSIWYWATKNKIPVFCPGLTDGAIGDILFFHSYERGGFIVDLVTDIRRINDIARKAKKSGLVVLGGGIIKHHVCNANLMRNGADYAVFINTGQEFDGSDAGARPDEAISWGKIRITAAPVKVYADATLVFPFVVAASFVRQVQRVTAAAHAEGVTDVEVIKARYAVAPAESADE